MGRLTYQLYVSLLIDENVLGLQVPMHDFQIEALLKGLKDGCRVENSNVWLESAGQFDQRAQRSVLAVLEDEIKMVSVHKSHLQSDDEWLVSQEL